MTEPRDLYLRCPVQLSARTPVLTDIFRGCTYALEADARIITNLIHDRTKRPEAVGPTHTPIQWVPGFFLSGVKRPGRDVDHSSSWNADAKNEWSLTLVSPVCLHGMDRDNFTFFMIQFLDVVQS